MWSNVRVSGLFGQDIQRLPSQAPESSGQCLSLITGLLQIYMPWHEKGLLRFAADKCRLIALVARSHEPAQVTPTIG
jgi:hypothetical protein